MKRRILHKLLYLLMPLMFAIISSNKAYACDNPPIAGTASISATLVCEGSQYSVSYEGGTGIATWQYWDGFGWIDELPANSTVYYIALYPASIVNGIPGDRFRVKTTTGGDCISYSNEVVVGYVSKPVAGTAGISKTDVCLGSSFTIKYVNVSLFVENPASISGKYSLVPAGFGPSVTGLIQGSLVLVNDVSGTASDACESIINSAELSGNIALIDRGTCSFTSKVLKAQQAGAIAVIVVNNLSTPPFTMTGSDPAITIPSLMISKADGDLIKANMITSPVHIKLGDLSTDTKTWQYWEDASSGWIDFADASPNPLSIEATNPYTMVNGLPGNRYRVKISNSICEVFSNEIAVSFNQLPVAGTVIISATAACLGSKFFTELVGASNVNDIHYWESYYEADGTWKIYAGSNAPNPLPSIALNPTAIVNGLPGDRLRVHYINSCGDQFSNEVSIIYAPYPEVNITAIPENITYTSNNPNTFYLGNGPQRITLQSSVTGDIGNGFKYNWTGTGLSCTNCASPAFEPIKPGNYTFTLTASTLLSASETGNNNALQLNGIDNYIEDNSVVLNASSGFTVEGWIKVNNADGINGLAAKTRENIPAPFDIYVNNGAVSFLAGDGYNYFIATTPGIITSNTWYHIACVYYPTVYYPGGIIKREIVVYVNGLQQARSEVNSNLIADNGTSFRIGSRSDNYYFTNGQVDEIRIWNTPRNTLDTKANMNSTIWANSAGLIAYYKLDETSGSSVLESVSNTNRGILRGSSANWEVPTTAPVQPEGLCPTTKSITINVKNATFCITTNINERICPGGSINMLVGGQDVVNCTTIGKTKLRFNSPAGIDFLSAPANFGPDLDATTLSGDVVYLPDISGSYFGCSAYPAGSLTGKIALIERSIPGSPFCASNVKTLNAQQAGAIGVILIHNSDCVAGVSFGLPGEDYSLITIPLVAVGKADGEKIKCWINSPKITNISWSPGTGLNTTTGGSVIATPATTTTYTASYTYGNGTTGSLSKTITVAPPVINIRVRSNPDDLYTGGNPNNIYLGYGPQKISLFVTSSFDFCGGKFAWTGAGLSSIIEGSCDFEPPGPGNYTITVTATSVAGCVVTKSITICVKNVRVPGKKTQIYMCHNSSKGSTTIILNPQDVPAHLAHGDALGQCGQGCGTNVSIASKSSSLAIDQETAGMMVYPNPAKNSVTVSFNAEKTEKYQLLVTDITGRAVLTKSDNTIYGNNKVQVNLTGIANGTYLIIVKKGHETLHTRIVKQ